VQPQAASVSPSVRGVVVETATTPVTRAVAVARPGQRATVRPADILRVLAEVGAAGVREAAEGRVPQAITTAVGVVAEAHGVMVVSVPKASSSSRTPPSSPQSPVPPFLSPPQPAVAISPSRGRPLQATAAQPSRDTRYIVIRPLLRRPSSPPSVTSRTTPTRPLQQAPPTTTASKRRMPSVTAYIPTKTTPRRSLPVPAPLTPAT